MAKGAEFSTFDYKVQRFELLVYVRQLCSWYPRFCCASAVTEVCVAMSEQAENWSRGEKAQ
jgi:hypothetical protein